MRRLNLTRMGQREPEKVMRSLPGDRCKADECVGRLTVYTTRIEAGMRVRFLECSNCGHKPNDSKWVTPIEGL